MNGITRLVATIAWLALPIWPPCLQSAQVVDDAGHIVVLEQPARRIMTLSPHTTELILALHLESRLVAVADFFDYPKTLIDVPRLSGHGGIDREILLLFNPDLVIAWGSGNRSSDIRWLKQSDIPVFVSEPSSLEDIADSLEKLGLLAGVPEQGKNAGDSFRNRLEHSCLQRKGTPPQDAFYEIWPTPPMTIGARHWLNRVLEKAALHNIFADIPRQVITISRESLLARSHEITILSHPVTVPASRKDQIVIADITLGRPGPRILEGLEKLCASLL